MVNRCCAKKKGGRRCTMIFKADAKYCHVHRKVIRNGGVVLDFPILPNPLDILDVEPGPDNLEPNAQEDDNNEYPELQKLKDVVNRHKKLLQSVKYERKVNGDTYIIEIGKFEEQKKIDDELDREIEEIYEDCTAECKVCFCEYGMNSIVTCGVSGHTSCTECTKMYITGAINDKKRVSCMFDPTDKCGNAYSDEMILITCGDDQKLHERYLEYQRVDQATQIATVIDNYHICPFCSKWGVIVENQFPGNHPQNIQNLTCGSCDTMFCIQCRKAYHGNDTCNKILNPNADEVRKVIDRVITDAIIHNCPKCHTKYMKMDGCNLMTCPSCKAYSCYLCDLVIRPKHGQKYWHFSSDKGRCPLYNHKGCTSVKDVTKGNTDYNNKRVLEALKKLLIENMDNVKVKKLLINDITKRGYKINK